MIISKELVLYDDTSTSQEDLFKKVESILLEKEIVNEGFGKALLEREKSYPTGIGIDGFNIALSHTDPKYSNTNEIMLVKLKEPIDFISMEDGLSLPVTYVFVLVLKDGDNHMKILQKLAIIMQDEKWIKKIKETNNKEKLLEVMNEAFS